MEDINTHVNIMARSMQTGDIWNATETRDMMSGKVRTVSD